MNPKQWFTQTGRILAVLIVAALCWAPAAVRAGDDDVPFFAGATGLPNVLFIFDNSDSMQDVPWPRKDGSTVRPSWRWRYGVNVDEDGTIAERDNGNIDYDYTKHVDTETEMNIPAFSPQPLPKLVGDSDLSGTVTRLDVPYRIYDSNVDWSDPLLDDWGTFQTHYRYRLIKVEDASGAAQYRSISSRSTGGGYFTFDRPDGDADNLDFSGAAPYTYTILTGTPGAVTRHYVRTDDRRGAYVFDANVDWGAVGADSSRWRNKLLVVTAGTNAGEQRRISWFSTGGKYWYLDPPLPENSDLTTRYKIVGSDDDDRYAYGGNHPESKLYQAKKALNLFLSSDAIKVCEEEDGAGNCTRERYLLNMGFATYMSARIPRVRAWYYRWRAGDDPPPYYRFRGYYMQRRNASDRYYYNANGEMSFVVDNFDSAPLGSTDYIDDREYTNASVGMQFDRIYAQGGCNEQIIRYTVTEIQDVPTDSQPDRIRFRCRAQVADSGDLDLANPDAGGYVWFGWRNFDHGSMAACTDAWNANGGGPPVIDGNYYLVPSDHSNPYNNANCYQAPVECYEIDPPERGGYYETTRRDTYGDYNIADADTPGYIDRDTGMVTPTEGYHGTGWSRNTSPNPESGDWTLMTADLTNVSINADGDIGDIIPYRRIYDYSYFRQPGEGTADRPFAWSYRRTADGYVYRRSYSYASTWEDDIQADPFFPAAVGDEEANHTGDDQVVFVNLPSYDATDLDYRGDDASGQNLAKILNYVSLTRVTDPNDTRYDKTMMPDTSSLAVNQYERITGKGTPLGASLDNAYQYYTSYIAQDDFTQGGCRNNYVILLTDGLETCDGDPAAAAETLLNMSINDRPAPVKTFVIGFGLGEESRETLDAIAEAGGTNRAYFARNVEELVDVLTSDILSEIAGGTYTRSAPVVSRILDADDSLKIYYAYFDYPVWRGHLEAYDLNADGTLGTALSGWTGYCDDDSTRGDAGCIMADAGRGTVYTRLADGTRVQFDETNVDLLAGLVNPDGDDINGDGTAGDNLDASTVVNYVLNPRYDNNKYAGTRDKVNFWPLGDIYNSVPVVVTNPKLPLTYRTGYNDFKSAAASRPTVIYVGANDGMLHAFDEVTGQEMWAYIPTAALGVLHELADGHRFTVDLTANVADVDLSGDGTAWKTMVVGGMRKGGNHYYALDVTDPANPLTMWETTDAHMGRTWSIANFGRIRIDGTDTSVVFVGGGYSTEADRGNSVYILRAADGAILKRFTVGGSANNVPSELLVLRYGTNASGMPIDYLTREEVGEDRRGFIEVVYFGDTAGDLWKVTGLNDEAGDAAWDPTLELLYRPANPQPIYHRPAVEDVSKNCQRRFVLFGTGDENAPTGVNQNYFYEIEDRNYDDSEEGPDFGAAWTSEQIDDGLFRLMWRKDLAYGEKVLSDPTVYRGVVYFTTYQPQGGCDMGFSYLYGLTTSTCGTADLDLGGGSGIDDSGAMGSTPEGVGGEGGLHYDQNDNLLDPHAEKLDLGQSIATTPIIAPPRMYLQKPGGGGAGMPPPASFRIPVDAGRLLYWRD